MLAKMLSGLSRVKWYHSGNGLETTKDNIHMTKANYLFPGSLNFNKRNGECWWQTIHCHEGNEGDFNIGDDLEINGKKTKVTNLEIVAPKNLPDGMGKTYRVILQQ